MAIRNLVLLGDDMLKEVSIEVKRFDDRLGVLIDDMIETMEHEDGVGLAAVQVGVPKRLCVVKDNERVIELINPSVIFSEGKQVFTEGCLSIPNRHGVVERPKTIKVKAFDRHGNEFKLEASDYLAVVISHELDHLDGILYIDRASEMLE